MAYLTDDEVFGGTAYLSDDEVFGSATKPEAPAAPPRDRTFLEGLKDTGAQLMEGAANIAAAVPNLIAPESGIAETTRSASEYWRNLQSEPLKQRMAAAEKSINVAGEEGVIAQVVEAAKQYSSDPALAARFVTTNLASMVPGIGAAKLAYAAKLAQGASIAGAVGAGTTASGVTNMVLNAGGARGDAFEDVKNTLIAQGKTPQEAEQIAIRDSRLPAAVGGAAGFVSGKVGGIEKAILGKGAVGSFGKGAAAKAVVPVATELGGEQIEELAPKLATNYQAGQYDNRPLTKDIGRTIVETAIGAGPGALAAGGITSINAMREPVAPPPTAPRVETQPTTPQAPAPTAAQQILAAEGTPAAAFESILQREGLTAPNNAATAQQTPAAPIPAAPAPTVVQDQYGAGAAPQVAQASTVIPQALDPVARLRAELETIKARQTQGNASADQAPKTIETQPPAQAVEASQPVAPTVLAAEMAAIKANQPVDQAQVPDAQNANAVNTQAPAFVPASLPEQINNTPAVPTGAPLGVTQPTQGATNSNPSTQTSQATQTLLKVKKPAGGKNLRKAAYAKNPMLTFLATHGLFHDKAQSGSLKSEFSPDRKVMVGGYGPVFKKTGMRLDVLLPLAIQDGYVPQNATESDLYNLVQKAIGGERVAPMFAEGVADQEIQAMIDSRFSDEPDFESVDPFNDLDFVPDDFDVPGYSEAADPIKAEVNVLLAKAAALGIDTETIQLDATYETREQSEQAYYEAVKQALEAAIAAQQGSDRTGRADTGETGNARVEVGLSNYTPAEVVSRQEQSEASDRAETAQRKANDQRARQEQERKDIAARSVAAADTFELGGDAEQNLSGQQTINENQVDLFGEQENNGNYEQDLFGQPLPSNSRSDLYRPAQRPAASGVRGDVHATGRIQDTKTTDGDYYVNTLVGTEVSRTLGTDSVLTPEQAAQATAYLYKSAVERFDAIVTDASGKPLAIVGGFKGAVSQASVYPGTIVAEAVRIPGAAKIWFSHNHPSGNAQLSSADIALNRTLSNVFSGSGIEPMGLLAVAGENFQYVGAAKDRYVDPTPISGKTPEASKSVKVPVIERELATRDIPLSVVTDPQSAMTMARALYGKSGVPGIMLFDSQLGLAAWVPIPVKMRGFLRNSGGLNAIYRAISQSNAHTALIVHGGELSKTGYLPDGLSASENIAAALQLMDVRVVDSIDVKSMRSAATSGAPIARGLVYSKSAKSNKPRNLDQDITLDIPVEGGKTAKLTVNAQTYITDLDARESALKMVKECML